MKSNFFLAVILLLINNQLCNSQVKSGSTDYSFMFYNTENFFDCENDVQTNDDEFTIDGDRRWSPARLHAKADRLAKVILAAGKWNPPIFVGLCEVENQNVLEILIRQTPLKNVQYKIVHKDSPDERGIDVAMIYRPELFRPFDYEAIPVTDPDDKSFRTRDILRVSGVINGCDTLHVFVNHWPSRYGGVMETVRLRNLAAMTLKSRISDLRFKFPSAKIICMGDFNDTPSDQSLASTLAAKEVDDPAVSGELVNLSYQWKSNPIQTIKTQYNWEVFDQWIVSDQFLEKNRCFSFLEAEIFKPDFILEPDSKFGGVKPKRTFIGFKYQEGFSDHLPILLRIQLNNH